MAAEVTADYLARHPREAAPILEQADREALHGLLGTLDVELQVKLLAALLPTTVAAYASARNPSDAAGLLARMRTDDAAQVLANMPLRPRAALLEALPAGPRARLQALLRYPNDAVGALMMTPAPACRKDATVRDAKRIVRRIADSETPALVVVDDNSRPVGLITIATLMRVAEKTAVTNHMRDVDAVIRVNDLTVDVAQMSFWRTGEYGVVVHSDGRFAGLLPKSRMYEADSKVPMKDAETPRITKIVLDIVDLLWTIGATILARGINTGEDRQ